MIRNDFAMPLAAVRYPHAAQASETHDFDRALDAARTPLAEVLAKLSANPALRGNVQVLEEILEAFASPSAPMEGPALVPMALRPVKAPSNKGATPTGLSH